MKTFDSISDFQTWRLGVKGKIGFVPTMGALHEGHLTLVREAKKHSEYVVVSIFVNPTQFNDPKDLEKYPRTIEADTQLLASAGADVVLLPKFETIYPDDYKYKITESDFSKKFCGTHRPGHFDGVLTIVMKLFQIVQPTKAFFGLKDYQQFHLISKMREAFFLPVEVVGIETVREADGLAMSSRNQLLSSQEREMAPQLYKILSTSATADEASIRLLNAGFRVDYVEDTGTRRLAAAFLGNVRLIDNVEIQHG
jgi:pantoate--beta-alanine ligase